ncbi:MAG: hypothetical protein ABEJ36_00245 [Candidatus Nanosalina sp.]
MPEFDHTPEDEIEVFEHELDGTDLSLVSSGLNGEYQANQERFEEILGEADAVVMPYLPAEDDWGNDIFWEVQRQAEHEDLTVYSTETDFAVTGTRGMGLLATIFPGAIGLSKLAESYSSPSRTIDDAETPEELEEQARTGLDRREFLKGAGLFGFSHYCFYSTELNSMAQTVFGTDDTHGVEDEVFLGSDDLADVMHTLGTIKAAEHEDDLAAVYHYQDALDINHYLENEDHRQLKQLVYTLPRELEGDFLTRYEHQDGNWQETGTI